MQSGISLPSLCSRSEPFLRVTFIEGYILFSIMVVYCRLQSRVQT